MRITPSEIRDKDFEKNFRGYDKDEVNDFLKFISLEFEALTKEKEELARRLETSEKESNKLRQVEESLFRTLKTAEDTGAAMIEEASKSSEEIMNEANKNATAIVEDAERQAQSILLSAEQKSQQIMEDLKSDVIGLVEDYSSLLAQRDVVLKNLKALSEDINDNISVSLEAFKKINVDVHAQMIEKLSKSDAFSKPKIAEVEQHESKPEAKKQEQPEDIEAERSQLEEENKKSSAVNEQEISEIKEPEAKEEIKESEHVNTENQKSVEWKIENPESEQKKKAEDKGGSFFDQFD